MNFNELGLSEKVLNAVEAAGYDTPTPIQEQAIPYALQGRDVLGIAQTGTGKTAAFTLPMLSLLERGRAKARMPRTLILEPTRELAAQVEEAFVKYGVNHKLSVALLIGGVSDGEQKTKIDRGADVVIATPGRLLDLTERGGLLLTGIEILVIDEADRMLDMGFIPDIERICKLVPFTRQTLFFSATMPPEITRLTEQFLHNPVRIEVSRAATTAENITQTLVPSGGAPHDKRATLRRIISGADNFKNALIFCNRKRDVQVVYRSLQKHGFSVDALHGDLDQRARMAALDAFRAGQVQLLDLLRRRRARPRHSRRQPRHQLRRAASFRGLRPPHRPHRPRRQDRPGADHRHPQRLEVDRRDREADRPQDRLAGRRRDASRRGGRRRGTPSRSARKPRRTRRAARPARRGAGAPRGSAGPFRRTRAAVPATSRRTAAAGRGRGADGATRVSQRRARRHRVERPAEERVAAPPVRPGEPGIDSRRHRAERPPQERVAAEQERFRERAARRRRSASARAAAPRRRRAGDRPRRPRAKLPSASRCRSGIPVRRNPSASRRTDRAASHGG